MPETWLYFVGGIFIGILILTIGYQLLTISIRQSQKQNVLLNFDSLYSTIETVCLQEIGNYRVINIEIPSLVRVIYATDDVDNVLPTVTDFIKNEESSLGNNICLQLKNENYLRCQNVSCSISMPYIGALESYNDFQLLVNKILGRPLIKKYDLIVNKTETESVKISHYNQFGFNVVSTSSSSTTSSSVSSSSSSTSSSSTTSSSTTSSTQNPLECLPDSPCSLGWPNHQGELREYNEIVYACDIFEVCHPELLEIVREARDCCENGCTSNCHSHCAQSRSDAGITTSQPIEHQIKKCSAFYLAYALGPEARIMEDYYYPEFECARIDDVSVDCEYYNEYGIIHNYQYAKDLRCNGCLDPSGFYNPQYLCGWSTDPDADTNMDKNSCYLSDLPAHVSATILKTGTCVDYSVVLTTLLRIAGFAKDEVYTVIGKDESFGMGHAWNIVMLPGESKWLVMDTVGNSGTPYVLNGLPNQNFDYCGAMGVFDGVSLGENGCTNDAEKRICPDRDEVYGC